MSLIILTVLFFVFLYYVKSILFLIHVFISSMTHLLNFLISRYVYSRFYLFTLPLSKSRCFALTCLCLLYIVDLVSLISLFIQYCLEIFSVYFIHLLKNSNILLTIILHRINSADIFNFLLFSSAIHILFSSFFREV